MQTKELFVCGALRQLLQAIHSNRKITQCMGDNSKTDNGLCKIIGYKHNVSGDIKWSGGDKNRERERARELSSMWSHLEYAINITCS